MSSKRLGNTVFRAGVGAVIINQAGEVLAFERIHVHGAWQLPQGGLEEDEEPGETVLREIEEETGIKEPSLELLAVYPDWLAYELDREKRGGKHGRGQVQKWFLFRFNGNPAEIQPMKSQNPEFSKWKWTTLLELTEETAHFRQPIYKKLAVEFARLLK